MRLNIGEKAQPYILLAPALLIILILFGGGLYLAILQSLNYLPFIGQTTLNLDAYRTVLSDDDFYRSLGVSLWIAIVSTALSSGLAIATALLLRNQFKGKRLATFIYQLNIPIPHIVGAIGILMLFSQSGMFARLAYVGGLIQDQSQFPALVFDKYSIGIILEYVWKNTCFIGIILLAILQANGDVYEQAAQSLGANRWQRFRHVTLPLLKPGVLSASTLVFAFTFGAFEVPFLLGRAYPQALPVLAYDQYTNIDLSARSQAMAISVLITIISTALILIYMRVTRREA